MRNTLRAISYHLSFIRQKVAGRSFRAKRTAQNVFAGKSLIFCVTNGRSGTGALASLFACIPQVHACHEEKTSFHLLMRWVQHNPSLARDFWLYTKLPEIAEIEKPVYLDTSHLIGKGFLEPLLAIGGRPKLVFLKRDPRLIAKSMLALGDVPGRTRRALKWYLSPADPVYWTLDGADRLSDYQLCYWHALETEARQEHYRRLCRNHDLTSAEADTHTLNDLAAFERLCAELGIELTDEARRNLDERIGQTLNSRTREKREKNIALTDDLDAAEAEVRRLMTAVVPSPKRTSIVHAYVSTALRKI